MKTKNSLPYRPCVAILLRNPSDLFFTGERLDTPNAWQVPQGGIDKKETPKQAAFRELEEEVGVSPSLIGEVRESKDWLYYDLPDHLVGKAWNGKFRGQKQKWFLMDFIGQDLDINIQTHHPEFRDWQWVTASELIKSIVPFKQDVYQKALTELIK